MKTYIKNLMTLLVGVMVVSCDDYLDVTPQGEYLEEQVFDSEERIESALNGVYINMTEAATYGGNLTMSAVEVLGQQYEQASTTNDWYSHAQYDYSDSGVMNTFESVWGQMYINILNLNNFLQGLDTYPGVVAEDKVNILRGEALALRAMMHLDLLRLYGPVYSTNPEDNAIPYSTEAKAETTQILSASQVIELVLEDLAAAEELLAQDPVREFGRIPVLEVDEGDLPEDSPLRDYEGDDFYRFRYLRMNYFAVKALQARTHLYAGNTQEANTAAKVVIDEASQWFPWTPEAEVISAGENPDRIFSSEVLFAIENNNLYARHNNYFRSSLGNNSILAPLASRLDGDIFEGNFNDYRYNPSWKLTNEKPYKTFFKYADVPKKDMEFRFMQPLIRMSEMYYIAAETEVAIDAALYYLNQVRFHRGLPDLTNGADLQVELQKEYRREFFGEGQIFFFHKRLNLPVILNASQQGEDITMGREQYVVPLPLSETNYR